MSAQTVIGIDVSRDWFDGFCLPGKQRFCFQNSPDGNARLLKILQSMPDDLKVGFEATGGQEWALWRVLISVELNAVQLPPAQIKAFALSMGKRAKTDQIDAELIARFMALRTEAGRTLPDVKLQFLRALTVRRARWWRHVNGFLPRFQRDAWETCHFRGEEDLPPTACSRKDWQLPAIILF